MPKPPPVVEEVGSPRPRKAILIHDDDDDHDGGSGGRWESRSVVGMGAGQGRRRRASFGDSGRGWEGPSGGRAAGRWSPPPRQSTLATPFPRAGAKKRRVIELDDDHEDGYQVRRKRPEKAAARVVIKEEPPEYSGDDSEDLRPRGRARAPASAPGGSRKAGKRKWESPVRRPKPHRAGGRAENGSSGKHKGGGSEMRGSVPARQVDADVSSRIRSRGGGSDCCGYVPARQVGAAVSSTIRSRNGDWRKVAPAAMYSDDDDMEEVGSRDNGESLHNQEDEQDVVKGKKEEDDNSDSECRYKSIEEEEEELGEDRDDIQDDSYAAVDEEDTDDDTTEQEEEEGEEEEESTEAGEDLRRTPSSITGPGGDRTPSIRKKKFEGLFLVDNADTTTVREGISKRLRSGRQCLDKKLLTRGTVGKPYCIDVSDSEPEEEVPPPAQMEKVQASEEDSDGAPAAKKRRRHQQIFRSDDSDSEDGTDDSDSEEDRTFAKRGPSSGKNGGACYQQQQAANGGCKDYEGCSNPRRVKNYAANAGNPANRGNLQQQGDVSFKKNALFPQKGKREGRSGEQDAYHNLFNSIFDEIENHPNGSAPAQAQPFVDTQPLLFSFGDEDYSLGNEDKVKVKSEHDELGELWGDFYSAFETVNGSSHYCEEGEESNVPEIPAGREALCKQGKHDLIHDDQIGIWCSRCNSIHLEARHVMAPMGKWSAEREPRADRELDKSINDILTSMGYEGECGVGSHRSGPVWDLIPGVREDMFSHQQEAFEFMWNKLAGGTDIEQVKNKVKTDALSGCVVSHAPGTGKTRLAITFVQSYLELFPRCSPVIIAPKGMLATWEHEFKKWNVKVPFHVLNSTDIHRDGDKTIERLAADREDFAQNLSTNSFDKKSRLKLKLLSWCEGNSVIGLSYKLFTNLAKEEGKDDDDADDDYGKIRQLLLQRPDLMVLDEGHIPRNSNSQIWKALTNVRTEKRIILSGTPFQNNFEELHNILCLLRGSTHDVDPGRDEGKGFWTSLKLKNVTDERVNEIRTKLDPFVHIHNGDILHKSLPGLRESVVILNPLPMQKKIIAMMEKYEAHGNLDLEYKISLASVHPFLIASIKTLSDEVASVVDQPSLERLRLKPYEGVKARFVYEIVRRCHSKERVLVFSQYLEPLDLIREQLSTRFHWTKDKEILQMSGKVNVKTRQSLMMAFNDMNSDAKVMLATTKACGEGIQLIGASRVVLLDVVWNPSVGRQAIGRAYRIGQEKIVYTYNLIAEGTQEKSKYDRQAQKENMSKKLFSNETQPAECNLSPAFIFSDRILEEMTEDENLNEMFVNILPSQ